MRVRMKGFNGTERRRDKPPLHKGKRREIPCFARNEGGALAIVKELLKAAD